MRLQYVTWQDVETYLKDNTGIIVPIGSTEQHGPTGLIGTDAICPELVAWEVGKTHNILVAPTLSIGIAELSKNDDHKSFLDRADEKL